MEELLFDFVCVEHKTPLVRSDKNLSCLATDCPTILYGNKYYLDAIGQAVPSQWDGYYEGLDTRNIFVNILNRLVSRFLLPLTVESITDEIMDRYPNSGKFVEVGCGEGTGSIRLLQSNKYKILFVDANGSALMAASSRLHKSGVHSGFQMLKADFYNSPLPLKDKEFDFSFNIGTIEHFENPEKAVREMARVSNRVACSVPAPSPYWWVGTQIRRLIEKDSTLWTENTRYYSLQALNRIFSDSGLTNIQLSQSRLFGIPVMNYAFGDA